MSTFISLGADSFLLTFLIRVFALLTFLLVSAWLLARFAGPYKAAFRSTVWTTSMVLALLVPFIAMLGQHEGLELIRIPIMAVAQPNDFPRDAVRGDTSHRNGSTALTTKQTLPNVMVNNWPMSSQDTVSSKSPNTGLASATAARESSRTITHGANEKMHFTQLAYDCIVYVWLVGVAIGFLRLAISTPRV